MEESKEHKESKDLAENHQKAMALVSALPSDVQTPLLSLLSLQLQRNTLYLQFTKELKSLESFYDTEYTSLYSQRAEYLKSYKGFWLKVLQNSPLCSSLIYEKDIKALEYLMDIKCLTDPDSDNFVIEFYFDQNPYFENQVLRKKYIMTNSDVMEKGIGTDIIWKELEGAAEVKDQSTFFNYFKSINMPTPAEFQGMDEDLERELVENVEQDYDIGVEFKDEIVPNAVLHYFSFSADSDKE